MNISEQTLESAINELVDQLDNDNQVGGIKLMNDSLFIVDTDTEYDTNFDIGEPKKKEKDKIIYI